MLFKALFSTEEMSFSSDTTRDIRVACRYGYELVSPISSAFEEPIVSFLPVLFYPKVSFRLNPSNSKQKPDWEIDENSSQDKSFIEKLYEAINVWKNQNHPEEQGGLYIFEVSVYSTLGDNLTPESVSIQPLLQFKTSVNADRMTTPLGSIRDD
jgi:hypothetical protein